MRSNKGPLPANMFGFSGQRLRQQGGFRRRTLVAAGLVDNVYTGGGTAGGRRRDGDLERKSTMADDCRLIIPKFLSPDACKELEFIHKSCSTVGYRPNVFSTTLPHLIATNSAHLIMPLVPIREKLKEKVEEHFGCEYELVVEFTGLISWCKGASIGWHSDDNRDYLKQRDFAAVCYLNSYQVDFDGGLFHFQDGEPSTIAPMAGILKGERTTLTLWFSRDACHDEDAKLLMSLSHCSLSSPIGSISSCFPTLASSNMYWFPPEEASRFQSGFDTCTARLNVLGFDIFSSFEEQEEDCSSSRKDSCYSMLESLKMPLYLTCGDKSTAWEFVNILHALQVVQFYDWKGAEFQLEAGEPNGSSSFPNVVSRPLSEIERLKMKRAKSVLIKDAQLSHMLFVGNNESLQVKKSFDRFVFSALVCEWESYTIRLREELARSLPYWATYGSIIFVNNCV
ncbi:2-oxoglutarate (2OG) and Fe(II)-dependent oxygenase superfamily protein [Striga hermonthica]|uniref:2-oxoglutarate (2OG) and Fe(II)-dependent oxygenase superfamily protein n=1 Tax=Striga hermonthica TaxID=68872 RepID=A0A9N7NX69_STRHE|nr:2-oxoglutarate (2OG) and Fe(II)-dependent oxygenase superfamily protein [Striga hermonthica]